MGGGLNGYFMGMLSGFHSVTVLSCFTLNDLEEHLVNFDKIDLIIFDDSAAIPHLGKHFP